MLDAPTTAFDGFAAALPERQGSFAERGCAMPFTAPLLGGARLRRSPLGRAEVILPALSGRGFYVLDWSACLLHCAPSLHDRRLWLLVCDQENPTPALVRAAAREVARQGYAGRGAQSAADAALRQQDQVRDGVRAALGKRFAGVPGAAGILGAMVAVLAQAGVGPGHLGNAAAAALPQALVALEAFAASLVVWAEMASTPQARRAAAVAQGAARMTLPAADAALEALWQEVEDLPARLAREELRPDHALQRLVELAARPDWLLDGWPTICALWAAAGPSGRQAALTEVVAMLPIPPKEADVWPGPRVDWDTLMRARRVVAPAGGGGGGGLVQLVQRNETLRGLAP
ncbi:hypothetical protein [Falsiroseomonas selenitidurans]|uniref:Uncharacterized protein n=1 Tax=Falsiroseomonas selenitidurans TaxID=2716335 RepID=A0ABX1E626_9PROT|nr:hypothetical protein [Falsiroseomonas selenitidurans]NKC32546.1 hypothetical protein [Falsiroseomonas selenitidurans]OYW10797.1 MAG: hypothetical protein B7Z53_00010 [Rhodospirillales bacterium 12-71-4]